MSKTNKQLEGYGLIHLTEEELEVWASEWVGIRKALGILVVGSDEESWEGAALGMMDPAVSLHLSQDSYLGKVYLIGPALDREG